MMKKQRRITQEYLIFAYDKYISLIHKLAFSIGIDIVHAEELRSQAIDELLQCMICYDGRGSFITFFHGRLTNVFQHMRDKEKRDRRIQATPPDHMKNMNETGYTLNYHTKIQECLELLTEYERDIILSSFLGGNTTREISNDHGVAYSTICRVKKEAIEKIKRGYKIGLK
jgi:RNA polymerase sigma factor (sigma-70 family)